MLHIDGTVNGAPDARREEATATLTANTHFTGFKFPHSEGEEKKKAYFIFCDVWVSTD